MNNQSSGSENFAELCANYVLDLLNKEERKTFEQMLSKATEKELALYEKMQSAADRPEFNREESGTPAEQKKRLLDEIDTEQPGLVRRDPGTAIDEERVQTEEESDYSWAAFTGVASFALLIVSLSLIFYSFSLSLEINKKESVIEEQEIQINELNNELEQQQEMLTILATRDIAMISLSGLEANPDGFGKIFWDPEQRQALLYISNLPPLPADQTYQLWIIQDNNPLSAGTFTVEEQEEVFLKINEIPKISLPSANAFAVTAERNDGVSQPSGEMYLMGNIDNQ